MARQQVGGAPSRSSDAVTKGYVDLIGQNRIVNGNFAINQRAKSGTVTLASGNGVRYGHDKWRAGASGCTYTFAASGVDTTVTISAGTLQQQIEPGWVEGGPYTLSWAGTAQARIGTGGAAPSGAYASSPITVAGAAAAQAIIAEWGTGTLGLVQLVPGTVAAPATTAGFLRRPYEIYLCQRYYYRIAANGGFDPFGIGVALSATNVALAVQFPRDMVANPTVNAAGTFFLQSAANITGIPGSAITLGSDNTSRAQVNIAVTGASAGAAYLLNAYSDSTAFIEFTAEL